MIIRDLAVALGLDVNAASFAEGQEFIALINAGLGLVVDSATEVGDVFTKQLAKTGDYVGGVAAATTATLAEFEAQAKKAATIHEYIASYVKLLWATILQVIGPVIAEVTSFAIKNALFIRDIFVGAFDFMRKNWATVKYALIAGVVAVTAAFVILKWEAIKTAAAAAAAWLAAAWPFILIGTLIAGLLLALDDLRVYLAGGDSLIGRWKKSLEAWLSIKADDPPWLRSIKSFLTRIKEALSKQGVIEGFFARIKGFFVDVWERIKSIDWSPFYKVFGWIADKVMEVDWAGWGERIKTAIGGVADRVKSVDWDGWLLALKGVGLKLWGAYLMIKGMVAGMAAFVEKIAAAGAALGRLPGRAVDFAVGLFGGKKKGEAAPSVAPGEGPMMPVDYTAYQPEAPSYYAPAQRQVTQHITREGDTYQITQLPGEDGEALAERVARRVLNGSNEDAAAQVPATE